MVKHCYFNDAEEVGRCGATNWFLLLIFCFDFVRSFVTQDPWRSTRMHYVLCSSECCVLLASGGSAMMKQLRWRELKGIVKETRNCLFVFVMSLHDLCSSTERVRRERIKRNESIVAAAVPWVYEKWKSFQRLSTSVYSALLLMIILEPRWHVQLCRVQRLYSMALSKPLWIRNVWINDQRVFVIVSVETITTKTHIAVLGCMSFLVIQKSVNCSCSLR